MKAEVPRLVSVAGSGRASSSAEQPAKQSLPMEVRHGGRRTDWSEVEDWKQLAGRDVTPSPM